MTHLRACTHFLSFKSWNIHASALGVYHWLMEAFLVNCKCYSSLSYRLTKGLNIILLSQNLLWWILTILKVFDLLLPLFLNLLKLYVESIQIINLQFIAKSIFNSLNWSIKVFVKIILNHFLFSFLKFLGFKRSFEMHVSNFRRIYLIYRLRMKKWITTWLVMVWTSDFWRITIS